MSQNPPIVVPIDADGTACNYLFLLAIAPTGINYSHQCGGLSCKHNEAEGFLVQVGDDQIRDELYSWFQNEFRGSCMNGTVWTANLIESLSGIISRISCWHTEADGTDRRGCLILDTSRIQECVEAWIPVNSPYGPGVLILDNSD